MQQLRAQQLGSLGIVHCSDSSLGAKHTRLAGSPFSEGRSPKLGHVRAPAAAVISKSVGLPGRAHLACPCPPTRHAVMTHSSPAPPPLPASVRRPRADDGGCIAPVCAARLQHAQGRGLTTLGGAQRLERQRAARMRHCATPRDKDAAGNQAAGPPATRACLHPSKRELLLRPPACSPSASGWVSTSNIVSAGSGRRASADRLQAKPGRLCWLIRTFCCAQRWGGSAADGVRRWSAASAPSPLVALQEARLVRRPAGEQGRE